MKYSPFREKPLLLLLFSILWLAGCDHKPQGPHHFIKLRAEGDPSQARFDSALTVLNHRLAMAYGDDVTARAEGKTIVLEVAGRPNLDSLAVLVLSKGGFGIYEIYASNKVVHPAQVVGVTSSVSALTDVEPGAVPELTYAIAPDTARLRKEFKDHNPSLNAIFVWGAEEPYHHAYPLYALKRPSSGEPLISKTMIKSAESQIDETGRPCVKILLKEAHFNTWKLVTRRSTGSYIAIKFGNQVLSSPVVNGEVPTGNMVINGNYRKLQTTMLAAMITTPDLETALQITHVDTALFVPLRGYPTLKQQARYEMVQAEFLNYRRQIDSLFSRIPKEQRHVVQDEMERIYRQDINAIAAETKATKTEVDDFITKTELALEGLKRRLAGTPPSSANDLQQMLESGPTP